MLGTVTAAVAAVGISAGAGWSRWRLGGEDATPELAWFHVHPPHTALWGGTDAVTVDAPVLARLAEGLGTAEPPLVAVAPPPKPDGPTQRSYAGLAALTRPAGRCILGVTVAHAATMPYAAAGCGLLARRLPGRPGGTRVVGTAVAEALPGWMVGTDDAGEPVTVDLPPGSTVQVCGAGASALVGTLPATGRGAGDVVVVTDADAWREAWHPQRCRVVVGEVPEVIVDLVVDLGAGELRCGPAVVPLQRLPLR